MATSARALKSNRRGSIPPLIFVAAKASSIKDLVTLVDMLDGRKLSTESLSDALDVFTFHLGKPRIPDHDMDPKEKQTRMKLAYLSLKGLYIIASTSPVYVMESVFGDRLFRSWTGGFGHMAYIQAHAKELDEDPRSLINYLTRYILLTLYFYQNEDQGRTPNIGRNEQFQSLVFALWFEYTGTDEVRQFVPQNVLSCLSADSFHLLLKAAGAPNAEEKVVRRCVNALKSITQVPDYDKWNLGETVAYCRILVFFAENRKIGIRKITINHGGANLVHRILCVIYGGPQHITFEGQAQRLMEISLECFRFMACAYFFEYRVVRKTFCSGLTFAYLGVLPFLRKTARIRERIDESDVDEKLVKLLRLTFDEYLPLSLMENKTIISMCGTMKMLTPDERRSLSATDIGSSWNRLEYLLAERFVIQEVYQAVRQRKHCNAVRWIA